MRRIYIGDSEDTDPRMLCHGKCGRNATALMLCPLEHVMFVSRNLSKFRKLCGKSEAILL